MKIASFSPLSLLVLLAGICSANAFSKKINNTWAELVDVLDDAQQSGEMWIFFEPFVIRGDGCPSVDDEGYHFYTNYLDVYCAYWKGGAGDGCVIDCPMIKNHFVVEGGCLISMDTITTSGALESSIHVKSMGFFKAIGSTFEYNGYERSEANPADVLEGSTVLSSGGAAVTIEPSALADLEQCHFYYNRASQGGAILNDGDVQVAGGSFHDNIAENGGAIFSSGSASIRQAVFRRNQALAPYENSSGKGLGGSIYTDYYLLLGGCTFEHNHADEEGGALFQEKGPARLMYCLWKFNTANKRGPAVAAANNELVSPPSNGPPVTARPGQIPGSNVFHFFNEGCGNVLGSQTTTRCDGVEGLGEDDCFDFSSTCEIPDEPTEAPSPAPTSAPTMTVMPSSSSMPSAEPLDRRRYLRLG